MDRKAWADLCRIAAIFGVVVIHACGANFYQFGKIPNSDWLAINLLDSLVRCSVPLFVMLSGALILSSKATLTTPLQVARRIKKVGVPLLTWNVAYLIYVAHYTNQDIDWLSMFRQAPMYHLWFVYMIIGLYLLLPIFQIVFAAISERADLQHYLLTLWVGITCVTVYYPLPILGLLQQTSLFGYAGYFLMGGIIATNHKRSDNPLFWMLVYLGSIFLTFWLTWFFSNEAQQADERAYQYFSPNVFVASVASFVLFSRMRIASERIRAILRYMSDRAFIVFFIHVIVLERVQNFVTTNLKMELAAETILIALLTYILCLGIASLLRLLPKSRILLG